MWRKKRDGRDTLRQHGADNYTELNFTRSWIYNIPYIPTNMHSTCIQVVIIYNVTLVFFFCLTDAQPGCFTRKHQLALSLITVCNSTTIVYFRYFLHLFSLVCYNYNFMITNKYTTTTAAAERECRILITIIWLQNINLCFKNLFGCWYFHVTTICSIGSSR